MATSSAVESKPSPPYAAFKTLENFVGTLRESAVPHQIDRSVMPKLSGVTQSQLLAAMRFLGLITPSGDATEVLRDLVGTEPDSAAWRMTLKRIVEDAYKAMLGGLDTRHATSKQLADRFRESNVDGATLQKAVRFYLKAMKSAGENVSPHLLTRKKRATGQRRSPPAAQARHPQPADTGNEADTRKSSDEEAKQGMMVVPLYFPGKQVGSVRVPADLSEEDCDMIDAILRAMAKRRTASTK